MNNTQNYCSKYYYKRKYYFLHFKLALYLLILPCPLDGQQFLTTADFQRALDEEGPVTFLTELDFNNARKYKDLLEVKARKKSSILTQQRFFRGDIRGKAAWRGERRQKLLGLLARRHHSSSRRFNGVSNVVKKWPDGRIPYVLSTEYSERERAVLARAFQEYQGRTCIRFVPKTPFDRDFLYIGKIDGCYSDVGRAGGKQELSLDDGCLHVDTVIHELMHSVGFYHEHERWDRDNYLLILWQNIDRDAYDQFGRVDLVESNYYGQGYDYHSIMHYDSLAFSRNGRETLLAREPTMTAVIGSAIDFSPTDLAKIHKMYQCLGEPLPPASSLEFTGDNSILGTAPHSPPLGFVPLPPVFRFPLASSSPLLGGPLGVPMPTALQRVPLSLSSVRLAQVPTNLPLYLRVNSASNGPELFRERARKEQEIRDNEEKRQNFEEKPLEKAACDDQLGLCPRWLAYCNAGGPFYGRLMGQFCARSCGLCPGQEGGGGRSMEQQQQMNTFPVLVNAQRR